MSELKFIEGPLNSEQIQSIVICAKLGHTTTPAVLVAILDQLAAETLRADTAEAELHHLREQLTERDATIENLNDRHDLGVQERDRLRSQLSAEKALRLENQRIVPVRFKCLACGDYHEGSGNLPCPKMSPYAALNPKPEVDFIGLAPCAVCSGDFGELKTYSNALPSKAYYVVCIRCEAKTSGQDKARQAVGEWNSNPNPEAGSHE